MNTSPAKEHRATQPRSPKPFASIKEAASEINRISEDISERTDATAASWAPTALEIVEPPTIADVESSDPEETQWAEAKKWVDAAGMFERGKLASQVMAGFALIEIRKGWRCSGHRNDLTSAQNEPRLGWQEQVKEKLGIGKETARRWIEMAEVAKPRLKKLGGADSFKRLLELPPSAWNAAQRESLAKAVHKITDGKTQVQYMLDLGVSKAPQGSAAKGGQQEKKKDEEEPPARIDETAEAQLMIMVTARRLSNEFFRELSSGVAQWGMLTDQDKAELTGLLKDIRDALKASAEIAQ
jgi:hypothetical protein